MFPLRGKGVPLLVLANLDLTHEEAAIVREFWKAARASHPSWHVCIQGNVVEFFRTGCKAPEHICRDKSAIGPWSKQSRMKLLRLLNRIDYGKVGGSLFVTLTYPDRVMRTEYRERTQDRNVFLRYVEKHLGQKVSGIWRIEWEQRKSGEYTGLLAPHFHLMLFGVEFLAWQKVREWWRKSTRAGDGPLVTEVKRIYNEDGACRYLSKYVSKYRSLDISAYLNSAVKFGRHWGCCRREGIPMMPVVLEHTLTDFEIEKVKAFAWSRWKDYDRENGGGFTLLDGHLAKTFAAFFNWSGHGRGKDVG